MAKKKSRALALASQLNSELGTDIKLGSDPFFEIERITSGSLVMDRVLGGGFALGRHYELFGDENSAKSYVAMRTIAESQSRGNRCAIVDPEHSYDRNWFAKLGGDTEELLVLQPETGEDAIAAMMLLATWAEDHDVEVVMLDSIASLVPKDEADVDPREEPRMAAQARMMSRALRRLTTVNRKTLFLWVNQERTNVGQRFGNPRMQSGGRALKYYATGRIEFRRGTKITAKRQVARGGKLVEAEVQVARWIQVRAEKEKSTRPYREGSFVFSSELDSIDVAYEVIQLGLEDHVIERTVKGYTYTDIDDHEWKGTEKQFTKMIRENDELRQELISIIRDNTENEDRIEEDDGT